MQSLSTSSTGLRLQLLHEALTAHSGFLTSSIRSQFSLQLHGVLSLHLSGSSPQQGLAKCRRVREFPQTIVVRAAETIAEQTEGIAAASNRNEEAGGDDAGDQEAGVIVVGAGLAGLAAARHLATAGEPFLLVEASDGVGGRVRTDQFEGFLLDRGFQIFITAYPEARRILDYDALNLQSFYAGALVWFDGRLHRVADPIRHLADGLLSLINPIGNAVDKVLVGLVRMRAAARADEEILSDVETTILQRVRSTGFSEGMVDRFFRPFFGGIFFDNQLQTTSRLFDFVFKCLALGSNTLPAAGIGAIPQQIADKLPKASVLLKSKVAELVFDRDRCPKGVKLEDGRILKCKHGLILAVEGPEAGRLLGGLLHNVPPSISKPPRSTVCLYFAADAIPIKEPILLLNGSGKGIINNMFFPTTVCKSYSPQGKALVSVSLVGFYENKTDDELEDAARTELGEWFGKGMVDAWKHLRTYRIKLAQPDQTPPTDLLKDPRILAGIYVCGDHRDSATFDGALVSGRRAAQALLADVKFAEV
ncbi:hypothetical protein GOP47_0028883 [Adiantum capillus-veneris]|nr:hypothetical protein GOP47_0028630 [Adiantum capillus-veneris]KAI5057065.1 hypothetical protein GOP47_0028883 [Adiantum capillus-veneris]